MVNPARHDIDRRENGDGAHHLRENMRDDWRGSLPGEVSRQQDERWPIQNTPKKKERRDFPEGRESSAQSGRAGARLIEQPASRNNGLVHHT
jgi:hypothetical protein